MEGMKSELKKKTLCLVALLTLSLLPALAQYVKKTDLPTVYIETFDGKTISSKEVYKYCRLHYVDESGYVTSYDSVSIRGRGNSTWGLSKKPYKIKFLNKEKFLGKGFAKCKKWTLLANAGDKTMIRNALTSCLGEFTSLAFNPAAKFVDLVLNDQYQGTYQISDQVDVRPHRVNITEQDYPVNDSTDISGGYLLEVDGFKDGNYFVTSRYQAPIRIHYPDDEEINTQQSRYIKEHVKKFETALASADFGDPQTGYRAYVDTVSLIDWYLCTEISANIDGFFSTYFYKEQGDDRLFWGPLWDYDIAYNNDQRVWSEQGLSSSVNAMMADIAYSGSKKWVNRMWDDPWFQKTVYSRYRQLLDKGLVDYMQSKIDSLSALLGQSQELNYEKWGISRKMYHEMVLYSSYDQYVSDLRTFVTEHCAYLEQAFAERKPIEPTPPFKPADCYYHMVNAKTMKAIGVADNLAVQQTNDRESESQDWYLKAVGDYFQIVNRSTELVLNDPTMGEIGPTTNVGTQLNTVTPDESDSRQLWNIVPQGTAGYYNLENVFSQHVANLSGGSAEDNTAILSYTSDSRNSESQNRLWYLVANGPLPVDITAIERVDEPENYALAYNPQAQLLHFGSDTPQALTFMAHVYALNGRRVGAFRANESFSMGKMATGVYVVTWNVGGHTRSAKFRK